MLNNSSENLVYNTPFLKNIIKISLLLLINYGSNANIFLKSSIEIKVWVILSLNDLLVKHDSTFSESFVSYIRRGYIKRDIIKVATNDRIIPRMSCSLLPENPKVKEMKKCCGESYSTYVL